MKLKEAIEICEVAIAEVEWNYPLDYAIAFETLVEAVRNGGRQSEKMDGQKTNTHGAAHNIDISTGTR